MTQLLFTVLLIAICPLMMFFMMRGMHSGGGRGDMHMQKPALSMLGSSTQDARIADLESQVARLSKSRPADGAPRSDVAERRHREVDEVSTASTR